MNEVIKVFSSIGTLAAAPGFLTLIYGKAKAPKGALMHWLVTQCTRRPIPVSASESLGHDAASVDFVHDLKLQAMRERRPAFLVMTDPPCASAAFGSNRRSRAFMTHGVCADIAIEVTTIGGSNRHIGRITKARHFEPFGFEFWTSQPVLAQSA